VIALEVQYCPGQRLCIVCLSLLRAVGSRREVPGKTPQPHCVELKSISNRIPLLISEGCEKLTDRIACDMLQRKFEHRGVMEYDSLNGEDSRAQSVKPGLLAAAEDVVECVAIVRRDAMRCDGSSKTLQLIFAIDANAQEAVVDELGRFF
jgi:hypothetical protein